MRTEARFFLSLAPFQCPKMFLFVIIYTANKFQELASNLTLRAPSPLTNQRKTQICKIQNRYIIE